jgi:hypothetical protein
VGAPSFRGLCERVGGTGFDSDFERATVYRSEVPTLAKNARVGHPLSWWSQKGGPPAPYSGREVDALTGCTRTEKHASEARGVLGKQRRDGPAFLVLSLWASSTSISNSGGDRPPAKVCPPAQEVPPKGSDNPEQHERVIMVVGYSQHDAGYGQID